MNFFLLLSTLLISNIIHAEDMSRTESYENVYKELANGEQVYTGACSTHQNYENTFFKVSEKLVEYFEPNYNERMSGIKKRLSKLEPELIAIAKKQLQINNFGEVDDLTVDKIEHWSYPNLNLFRMDVGVGGGNGIILFYNRVQKGPTIYYQLMSEIMDGDIDFCDRAVWLK